MRVNKTPATWLALLVVTVTLSGCSDEAPKELQTDLAPDAIVTDDGRDLRKDLTVEDSLPGPAWKVGDWFGHHIFFGTDDTEGQHINVIVTEDQGDSWYLVSEDTEVSMYEAMFDIPITGALSKSDLDTTAFGGAWEVYDFPMKHNKTWTGTLTMDADLAYDLTFTATYQESFRTEKGNRPGFAITGVDAEGRTVVETDYVPAIGWYTEFVAYDPDSEDPESPAFRSTSMGTGEGWTGELVEYEVQGFLSTSTDVNPGQPGVPGAVESVSVPDDASHVAGILYSYAATGASTLRLVDSEGTVRVEQTGTHTGAEGGTGTGDLYVMDAVAGDWQLAWTGPAVASGFGALLWSLKEVVSSVGGAQEGETG